MQQRDLRKGICGWPSLTGVQRQTGKAPLWVLIVLGILSGLLMYGTRRRSEYAVLGA
jgi:hypothetical protein